MDPAKKGLKDTILSLKSPWGFRFGGSLMDQNDLMSALVTHLNYPAKTNMTMENQTFEDVLNIVIFHFHGSFWGCIAA